MSTQRKLYTFSAVVFCLGAIGAIIKSEWSALVVFVVLALFMFWIAARVDALMAKAEAAQAERDAEERRGPRTPRR